MKQIVRLTESDIHRIIKQVITEALDEGPKATGEHRRQLNKLMQQLILHLYEQHYIKAVQQFTLSS